MWKLAEKWCRLYALKHCIVAVLDCSLQKARSQPYLPCLCGPGSAATHLKRIDLPHDPYEAMYEAAMLGKLDAVKWLVNQYSDGTTVDLFSCCEITDGRGRGSLPWTFGAASNGHLEVVKWLHANSNEGCTTFAMSADAANGHLEVVKGLHANRSESVGKTCWTASLLNTFVWRMTARYFEPNALVENQLPVVQWLMKMVLKLVRL
ncbi:Ankyrin repeat-containing domain [Phytophthora cactorum]|nr:Ankyrin repeat-containing domain [Phytophthora cactorum]